MSLNKKETNDSGFEVDMEVDFCSRFLTKVLCGHLCKDLDVSFLRKIPKKMLCILTNCVVSNICIVCTAYRDVMKKSIFLVL